MMGVIVGCVAGVANLENVVETYCPIVDADSFVLGTRPTFLLTGHEGARDARVGRVRIANSAGGRWWTSGEERKGLSRLRRKHKFHLGLT